MGNLIIPIFILISLIVQLSILNTINFFNIKPDLLLILAIFFNIHFPFKKGLIIGGICGLLKDIFSSEVFGLNLFTFTICIFIFKIVKKHFYKETFWMRIFVVFLISLLNSIIYLIFRVVILELNFAIIFLLIAFLESAYTALFSQIVFIPFKRCVLKLSI